MTTLFEHVTGWMYHQQRKHGFDEDYPEQLVNRMSNWELLQCISEFLEEAGIEIKPDEE